MPFRIAPFDNTRPSFDFDELFDVFEADSDLDDQLHD
jgi:hypothetical protein